MYVPGLSDDFQGTQEGKVTNLELPQEAQQNVPASALGSLSLTSAAKDLRAFVAERKLDVNTAGDLRSPAAKRELFDAIQEAIMADAPDVEGDLFTGFFSTLATSLTVELFDFTT